MFSLRHTLITIFKFVSGVDDDDGDGGGGDDGGGGGGGGGGGDDDAEDDGKSQVAKLDGGRVEAN